MNRNKEKSIIKYNKYKRIALGNKINNILTTCGKLYLIELIIW